MVSKYSTQSKAKNIHMMREMQELKPWQDLAFLKPLLTSHDLGIMSHRHVFLQGLQGTQLSSVDAQISSNMYPSQSEPLHEGPPTSYIKQTTPL